MKNSGYGKFGGNADIESFTEPRWVTIQNRGQVAYPLKDGSRLGSRSGGLAAMVCDLFCGYPPGW